MKPEEIWETWKDSWEFLLHISIVLSPFIIVGALIVALIRWVT